MFKISREGVQENPEPETDTPADPAISVEARNAYGYTDDAMLPLTKERAMELFERDVPVYLLYGDNTEAMAFEQTEILNHDGIFGIDRADWEAVKEQFPVATENRWQKAFQQNPSTESSTGLRIKWLLSAFRVKWEMPC